MITYAVLVVSSPIWVAVQMINFLTDDEEED